MDKFNWKIVKNRTYYRERRRLRDKINKIGTPLWNNQLINVVNNKPSCAISGLKPNVTERSLGENDLECELLIHPPSPEVLSAPEAIAESCKEGTNIAIIDDVNDSDGAECDVDDPYTDVMGEINKNNGTFQLKLKVWSLEYGIAHVAVNRLLHILNEHVNERIPKLPFDSRTFFVTPKSIEIKQFIDGEYWHQGLIVCLNNFFHDLNQSMQISLNVNIDGLPIHKGTYIAVSLCM